MPDPPATQASAAPTNTSKVNPPEKFSFVSEEWPGWIRRYNRYRRVSGLNKQPEAEQIDHLIYSLGDQAEDVFDSFTFETATDADKYDKVVEKFEAHFVAKRNVVYERAVFNRRVQKEGEDVTTFITDLYTLSKHCEYKTLRDELIRDRIVVGVLDREVSEELQMDASLTLEKARSKATLAEQVRKQQAVLRGGEENAPSTPSLDVNAVNKRFKGSRGRQGERTPPSKSSRPKSGSRPNSGYRPKSDKQCRRCGEEPHPRSSCPALREKCGRCNLFGHATKMCRTRSVNCVTDRRDSASTEEEYFVHRVKKAPGTGEKPPGWTVNVAINTVPIALKVDTGADCSILNWRDFCKLPHAKLSESNINLYGPGRKRLLISGVTRVEFSWNGQRAGGNFYVGEPNTEYESLMGLPEIISMKLIRWPPAEPAVATIRLVKSEQSGIDVVAQQHPRLFDGIGQLKGRYNIELVEGAKPYAITSPRRIPVPLRKAVRTELDRLEEKGVIEKINEPTDWCAGMVVVPKPNHQVRICVDLQRLNEHIKRERYIMPKVEEALALLGEGNTLFSKLDARSGYWQVPLTAQAAKLTCFITPFGRYIFKVMPMGLSSAAEHYERKMRDTLRGLEGWVSLQDDILIFGKNRDEHDYRLNQVLARLEEAGVTLNKEKCVIRAPQVRFLGYIVSKHGISSDPEKVDAVLQFKAPTNVSEVRSFLGLLNQHSKFIKDFAERTKPLRELLVKGNEWTWDQPQQLAFRTLKEAVTKTPVLAPFDPNLDTRVTSDACRYGIGGLMEQKQPDGDWRPISFCSRSLSPTEQRYAVLEKEALAATWVSERFADYLTGIKYKMVVDHKPLVSLLGGKDLCQLTARIQRFRMRLMVFNYTVEYQPGRILAAADALSRSPVELPRDTDLTFERSLEASIGCVTAKMNCSDVNIERVRKAQDSDPATTYLKGYIQSGWPKEAQTNPLTTNFFRFRESLAFLDGLVLYEDRLYIPSQLRQYMLDRLHAGHLGIEKCRRRARSSMWWPNINNDIMSYVAACDTCLKFQVNRTEPMLPTRLPSAPWREVGADVGYFNGKCYLLIEDYFSRYPEIANLSSISTQRVIEASKAIFARHGIPLVMRVDAGTQFTSKEFKEFATDWGMQLNICSPKHSRSNGLAEAGEKAIKKILRKSEDPYLGLLSYRTSPLESGMSPAELLMGRKLRTTIPQIEFTPSTSMRQFHSKEMKLKQRQERNFNERHNSKNLGELRQGDVVWITDMKKTGKIVRGTEHPRSYVVQTQNGCYTRNRANLIQKRRSFAPTSQSSPQEKKSGEEKEDEDSEAGSTNDQTTPTASTPPPIPSGKSHPSRQGKGESSRSQISRPTTPVSTHAYQEPAGDANQKSRFTSRGRPIKTPKRLNL